MTPPPVDVGAVLREIVDHVTAHDLAHTVSSISPSRFGRRLHEVHASPRSDKDGSAIEVLSQWAASLAAHRVSADLKFNSFAKGGAYHLRVTGELPSGAQLEVTVVTDSAETTALAADDLSGEVRLTSVVTAAAAAEGLS